MHKHDRIFLILLLLLFIVQPYKFLPTQDLVGQIPGINYNIHKWYSGYLQWPGNKFHYVYFDSQRDPYNDPIMLFLHGGPGCSSLIAMLYQNGPFIYQHNTTQLTLNGYSWNNKANVLYIESPGGVGYSFTNRTYHSDATAAQDNLNAVLKFFEKFPNLRKNQFYLSGQSYGGIYIPWLAWKISLYNDLPSSKDTLINLKGFMVGNPCTDPLQCILPGRYGLSVYQYQFLYKHGFYTQIQYQVFKRACITDYNSTQCQNIRKRMDQFFVSTRTWVEDIYARCYADDMINENFNIYELVNEERNFTYKMTKSGKNILTQTGQQCDDDIGINDFFSKYGNFESLHVPDDIQFQQCNQTLYDIWDIFENASIWIYPQLIKRNIRILVYSGDADALVPITGTVDWIQRFQHQQGLPTIQAWRQWWVKGMHKNQDQVGGMTWRIKGLTFVSIKGGGHSPQDKKKESFTMFDSFMNNVPLPRKDQS